VSSSERLTSQATACQTLGAVSARILRSWSITQHPPIGPTYRICRRTTHARRRLSSPVPDELLKHLSKAVYTGKTLPNPSAGRGGVEEFFRIVQPTPGTTFTVNTQGTTFNTILSVWTVQVLPETVFVRGNCGALTELVSTNGGFNSQLTFTADGSNDYYIIAEPLNNGAGGNFVLNVNASSSPITVNPLGLVFAPQVILTASGSQTVTYLNGATVPWILRIWKSRARTPPISRCLRRPVRIVFWRRVRIALSASCSLHRRGRWAYVRRTWSSRTMPPAVRAPYRSAEPQLRRRRSFA